MSTHQCSAESLRDQGWQLHCAGDLAGAEGLYRRALVDLPNDPALHFYLGTCLLQQESKADEGAAFLSQLLDQDPVPQGALINLGLYHHTRDNFSKAEQLYRQALLRGDDAELHAKLAVTLQELKRPDEAIFHYQQSLLRNPAQPDRYFALVGLLRERGRFVEACIWAGLWLQVEPDSQMARAERGIAWARARFYDEAAADIFSLDEADANVLFFKAYLKQYLLQFEPSIHEYRRLLAKLPDLPGARFNLSLLLLAEGQFPEGWREFDQRFAKSSVLGSHGHTEPEWDGRPLAGQGVLVHSEQGLGDVIQFMRFFPLIQQRGGRVIFQSYPDVLALMKASPDAAPVTDLSTVDLTYQYQIPLLSLGKIFVNAEDDIPADVPYLQTTKAKSLKWAERLSGLSGFKVGLVWAGNPEHTNDHNRSMSLEDFSPLAQVAGTTWVALQKGPTSAQAGAPPLGMHVVSLSNEIEDFTDTAAIIEQLDLVICVDTSVAHLAGALNRPVWMLIPDIADWRWLNGRTDSPWYPSMRIFQRGPSETWPDLVSTVAEALRLKWQEQAPTTTLFTTEDQWQSHGEPGTLDALVEKLREQGASESYLEARVPCWLGDAWQLPPHNLSVSVSPAAAEWAAIRTLRLDGDCGAASARAAAALTEWPAYWKLEYELGDSLRRLNDDVAAIPHYRSVLKHSPRHVEAGINLAMALERQGQALEAIQTLQRTALANPMHPLVWRFLGVLLYRARYYDLALHVLEANSRRFPDDRDGKFWLAAAHRQLGAYGLARALLEELLTADMHEPHVMREHAYACLGEAPGTYESIYARLLQALPRNTHPELLHELGMQQVAAADHMAGWRNMEQRRSVKLSDTFEQQFENRLPPWRGEPLAGRRLLVYCEQGFGDTLQFIRFVLAIPGNKVVIVQDGLEELLAKRMQSDEVAWVSRNTYRASPVSADCYANLLSLPLLTGRVMSPDWHFGAYLAQSQDVNRFADLLGEETRLRIGLVWAGNPKHAADHQRSLHLLSLLPVLRLPKIAWYSLQKGAPSNQALLLPKEITFLNAASLAESFEDTAQLIEQLDLVISVDTAVAHLAAALGKPTWLVIARNPDWRWGHAGNCTDWYETMRIFRQHVPLQWGQVVEELTAALQDFGGAQCPSA